MLGKKIRYMKTKSGGYGHADQADQGAMTATAVGDLGATNSTPYGYDSEAHADAVHIAIDKLVADVTALDTLLTAIRTALVEAGLMKGAA